MQSLLGLVLYDSCATDTTPFVPVQCRPLSPQHRILHAPYPTALGYKCNMNIAVFRCAFTVCSAEMVMVRWPKLNSTGLFSHPFPPITQATTSPSHRTDTLPSLSMTLTVATWCQPFQMMGIRRSLPDETTLADQVYCAKVGRTHWTIFI
jgi:hypothetical protein